MTRNKDTKMDKSRRQLVLEEAIEYITKDRNTSYGTPEQNFQLIASLWTTYLEKTIQPHDVAVLMTLLKIARLKTSPTNRDNWVDLAGYAACGEEVAKAPGTFITVPESPKPYFQGAWSK